MRREPTLFLAVAVAAAFVGAVPAVVQAQAPLRAGVLGSPSVGKPAPAIQLPYLTTTGPGPADQPFQLGAELGRVVILLFGGTADTSVASEWRQLTRRASVLVGRSVVAVGVLRGRADQVQRLAVQVGDDFKFLVDAESRGHRAYGLGGATRSWSAFVVGDDGRLVWAGRVDPAREADWVAVAEATERGHTARQPLD